MKYWLLSLLCCVPLWVNADDALRVEFPRVRETLPAQTVSSAYFTLVNDGDVDAVLVGACSEQSPRVEVHEHRHENGMMQMRKVEAVVVPAHGRLVFEPGGLHLMLLDLPTPLIAGGSVSVMLRFEKETALIVVMPVQTVQQTLQTPEHGHHH